MLLLLMLLFLLLLLLLLLLLRRRRSRGLVTFRTKLRALVRVLTIAILFFLLIIVVVVRRLVSRWPVASKAWLAGLMLLLREALQAAYP